MDKELIIISMFGLAIIILMFWIIKIELRLKRIFMGTNAKNLEKVLNIIGHHIENLEKTQIEINKHLETVDARLLKNIRKIETVRFNAFEESGNNQSFAIAMLNDDGDGVVISSLYTRDRMSVFAKPVIGGKTTQDLTKEEKTVLEKAK